MSSSTRPCSSWRAGRSWGRGWSRCRGEQPATILRILTGVPGVVRRLLEEVSLEMVAVHQDEVEMVLQMELLVTPALLPAFSLPVTTHLYFDEDTGGTQKIFRWGH